VQLQEIAARDRAVTAARPRLVRVLPDVERRAAFVLCGGMEDSADVAELRRLAAQLREARLALREEVRRSRTRRETGRIGGARTVGGGEFAPAKAADNREEA